MYKRILVAVDGSENAILALEEALALAKDQHALVRMIYVADEFVVVGEGVPFDFEKYETSIHEYGQSILNEMEAIAKKSGVPFEMDLIENTEYEVRIHEKIIKAAKDWHADLLVIGTHGRRGFSRLMLGSVAEGVTRMAPIPVLLIRGKMK
jgi:nucleotide-binding universal stress UspA family protein